MHHGPSRRWSLSLEILESRQLLSGLPMVVAAPPVAWPGGTQLVSGLHPTYQELTDPGSLLPLATAGAQGFSPSQIHHAYGIDQVSFANGTIPGNGNGQTMAIIDAYHDPTIASDLHAFDQAFGLPDPPSFQVVAQDGSHNLPPVDPAGPGHSNWEGEIALDVQWAHAIAPGANILLVEANNPSPSNLFAAVDFARRAPGVSVVSMSFGGNEVSGIEARYDGLFTTPPGHNGVTFVASTGDNGQPGGYPAYSPNVVAVGGTSLALDALGNYQSETGWSGSGGGASQFEPQPAYQNGVVSQTNAARTIPDLSFVADPRTGVSVYDSYNNGTARPWSVFGGSSLAAPCTAGMFAIANQGRALSGQNTLDSGSAALPLIYGAPASDFHDVTSGNNGFAAGPGYDLVTGRGSPQASLLIPYLVNGTSPPPPATNQPTIASLSANATSLSAGQTLTLTANGVSDPGATGVTVTFFQETNGQPGLQTGTGGDLAFTPVAGGSNSIALDTSNVTGAFTFYAQVTDASGAASPAGTSAPSVTVSILPPGGSTPTITGLSASPNPVISGDMLALTVNGVSDPGGTVHRVVYYQETNGQPGLQTGINGDFSFTPVLAIQGPGFPLLLDTSGAAGSFTFYAQAIDSQGNVSPDGTAAPAVTVTVESGSPPTAPSGLTATPVSPTEVDLTFSEASGTADGYTIERSQESTFVTFTRVFTINRPNTTTYNDVGLAPGTRYFYRVQAFNLAGNSAFSEVANAQTLGGAAPMGPLDGRYVNQLFSDLLGRPASAQDVAGFSTMLDQGAAADALPLLILNSDEYRSNGIQGFFSNVLHRSADPNEVNAFLSQLAAGATDEQLAATIYGSDEYNALHGATTQGFLSGLFADALARPLDAAGLAAFGPALESGQMTRTQVAMAVLTSPEVRARQVTAWYQQLLRRDPDSGGLAAFSGVLAGGGRDENVVASLASSHEYFATRLVAVGTLNESFLDQAYRDLLGRPVDTAGLAAFGPALDTRPDPAGRQAVVERIDTSSEYRANLVQGCYQRFLGRSASAGELDVWTAALASGATDETVMAAFAGSNEYYVKHGATNANFLLATYSDLVGQPANIQSPEYLNLLAALNNGTMSPGSVAKTLLSKQTYRDDLVSGLYQGLLRRPADSGGQAAFSNQLIAGATDENVIAELISSPEYYHNVAG